MAVKKFGSDYYFLKKQAVFARDRHLRRWSPAGTSPTRPTGRWPTRCWRSAMLLLAAVLFSPLRGHGRRVEPVAAPRACRFQPSEFARLALIVYMAYSLEKKADRISEFSIGFLPHVVVLGILARPGPEAAGLRVGRDPGRPDLADDVRRRGAADLPLSSCVLASGWPAAYVITHAGYRGAGASMSFLNPWQYRPDEGYQIVHSLMAFGTGGWWGAGIGNGVQKLFYLPEPHTDFIFSVIGEELGLAGVLVDHPALPADRLEGDPHRAQRAGPVRLLPGRRAHGRAGAADLHQHGGHPGAAAHQGADAALPQLRRHVAGVEHGDRRDPDEHRGGGRTARGLA